MAYPNQLPRVDEILTPGIEWLRQNRPQAYAYIQSGGRYADLALGLRAQARMALSYLTDQVVCARLGTAKQPMAVAAALTELAQSEFDTERGAGAVAAIGSINLVRSAGGTGGAVPKGTRIRRDANTKVVPQVPGALYTVAQDTPWGYGSTTLNVPIVASKPGAASNAPVYVDSTGIWTLGQAEISVVDSLFDASIEPAASYPIYEASGGLDSESDGDLIAQASAYAAGQFGPTLGAITAGALRGTGAHRVLVRDIYSWDLTVAGDGLAGAAAVTGVVLADASWAGGGLSGAGPLGTWASQVAQSIQSLFQGFGLAIAVTGVTNIPIAVECAVTLRDANDLAYTSDITTAIQMAVASYFDDRPDWYTWSNTAGIYGGLRAAIVGADRRVLSCQTATVTRVSDALTLTPPTAIPIALNNGTRRGSGFTAYHWQLVQNGLSASFASPN